MFKKQILSDEVGTLDRLIAAISSEIESDRASANHQDEVLREMEDALAELRLARGVRLMLLNAQNAQWRSRAVGSHAETQRRRQVHAHLPDSWRRAGRRPV